MNTAVKMADGADDVLEGLGIPWGGNFNGKDIEGEWFTKSTDFALDWFGPGERPLLYEHGFDADAGISVVGRVQDYKSTDLGVWTQVQLDKSSEYFEAITQLVKAGRLFFSSGSLTHLARKKKSGEITAWPWIELSLTTHPANLLAELEFSTAEKHFEAAGVKSATLDLIKTELDKDASAQAALKAINAAILGGIERADTALKTEASIRRGVADIEAGRSSTAENVDELLADLHAVKDMPDGPTMMADADGGPFPEGSYEDLADDIRQALCKQTGNYAYVIATFPGYALVRCCGDDSDTDDMNGMPDMDYYRVAYTLDEMGEPVLGEMQEVEPAMIPAEGKSATLPLLQSDEAPLAVHAARLSEYADLLLVRTQGVQERRIKEGRVLSTSNRDRLTSTADALDGALKAIRDLLDTTEPQPAKAASVDRTAQRLRELEGLKVWAEVTL